MTPPEEGPPAASHGIAGAALEGRATAEGTRRYASRFADRRGRGGYRAAWNGLSLSCVGFGGYRVHGGDPEHRRALSRALRGGVNVVDTSSNYTRGESERLVGAAVCAAVSDGVCARDEVVVVSKVGYVQGDALERMRAAGDGPHAERETVRVAHDAWHCIRPDFVESELRASLDRLGLASLDAYLLHNPEYFLYDAFERGGAAGAEAARDELLRRLRGAFAALERAVGEGLIGAYGVSSNTLPAAAADPLGVRLGELLQVAGEAAQAETGSAEHHLHVIQFPLNVLESAATERRDATAPSLLQAAKTAGLTVLANRPVNAVDERPGDGAGRLLPLVDPRPGLLEVSEDEVDGRVERAAIAFARAERSLEAVVPVVGGGGLGVALLKSWRGVEWPDQLSSVLERTLVPRSGDLVRRAREAAGRLPPEQARRVEAGVTALGRALKAYASAARRRVARRQAAAVSVWRCRLVDALGTSTDNQSTARLALRWVAAQEGVTCALNGMRTSDYVNDALAVMAGMG